MTRSLAILVLLLVASSGRAAPIVFDFTGTGSGTLNQTAFTDAAFEIRVFGHTEDVGDPSLNLDLTANLSSLFSIAGLGQGSFSDALFVFGGAGENFFGFGTIPNGNLIAFFPSIVTPDEIFLPFDLKSDFGPVVDTNSSLYQFVSVPTTLGILTFDTMSPVTFTARVTPEPGALALLGLGLSVAGLRRRCAQA